MLYIIVQKSKQFPAFSVHKGYVQVVAQQTVYNLSDAGGGFELPEILNSEI